MESAALEKAATISIGRQARIARSASPEQRTVPPTRHVQQTELVVEVGDEPNVVMAGDQLGKERSAVAPRANNEHEHVSHPRH
jgi:hypothetical protein